MLEQKLNKWFIDKQYFFKYGNNRIIDMTLYFIKKSHQKVIISNHSNGLSNMAGLTLKISISAFFF